MADATTETGQQVHQPNLMLKTLERLVGTWNVADQKISGQVTFEWMGGGGFLIQHVDLVHDGHQIKGIEYIGYHNESKSLRSYYFDSTGYILEYEWEISGDTLTIWGGTKGSAAKFTGKFSVDGNSNAGAWEWPGGGYESTMTRANRT